MELVRKIQRTTLATSLAFVLLFGSTVVISYLMLELKELSNQTTRVNSEWNQLKRITKDVLYYRLDSVDRLSRIEDDWIKTTNALHESFLTLRDNRLLGILHEGVSRQVEEAWYLWLYSMGKLNDGQRVFREVMADSQFQESLFVGEGPDTIRGVLVYLIEHGDSHQDIAVYRSFLSHMYVLDITSDGVTSKLHYINEQIPDEINEYIIYLFIMVGLVMVVVVFVSVLSARKLMKPILLVADAVRGMSEDDYRDGFHRSTTYDENNELSIIQKGFHRMASRIHALHDESLRKETEKRKAQYRALQYQINPHFLYNTLGTLRMTATMNGDSEMADNIQSLSRLLRNTITSCDSFISVTQEIDIMNDYLNILQIRYKRRIKVQMEFRESIMELYIPSLLLQPLIENAVLHGLTTKLNQKHEDPSLVIGGCIDEGRLLLYVRDNGCGIPVEKRASILQNTHTTDRNYRIGLKNIRDRIQLLYGTEFGVIVDSVLGSYTEVKLVLPVIEDEEYAKTFDR